MPRHIDLRAMLLVMKDWAPLHMLRGRPARRRHSQRRTFEHNLFGYFLVRSSPQGGISRRRCFPYPCFFQPGESFPIGRLSSLGKHLLSRYHTSWPCFPLAYPWPIQNAGTTNCNQPLRPVLFLIYGGTPPNRTLIRGQARVSDLGHR